MKTLHIDLIDIINNGGFLKSLPCLKREAFLHHCQIETMKSAILYTAKIGIFDIEIGISKKGDNNYELLNLSEDKQALSDIAIDDKNGIMKTNFNDLLSSNIIQSLPKYTVNHIDDIGQIEILFYSGSTLIYQNANLPPVLISNSLTVDIF
ncbi:hypothetical protein A9G45_08795 [Gilliamella sp. HK2]|uniref:hypothetical protein n=1 Tax=unclassified Gilliamella TaxID=2685620 RepID=UPI00080DE59C|nr:hypothetical protein [Gilliamella apicola]OCG26763.1 hypothetical protein A9G46_04125 [Gilliamella apicola]OCG27451.1 hypothetical protein A9G45_08795 [Gilliamella apicola]